MNINDFTGGYNIVDNSQVEFVLDTERSENSPLKDDAIVKELMRVLTQAYPACRFISAKRFDNILVLSARGAVNLPAEYNVKVTDTKVKK